jgi:DNA polymerase-3 subunit epsilon
VRLARAVVSAEGMQAIVAPSTEPGVIEVFVLHGGRLVAHRGFEAADTMSLAGFADEVLARPEEPDPRSGKEGSNEARIVAAYLRRRCTVVEAIRLRETRDLMAAVGRISEAAEEEAAPLA